MSPTLSRFSHFSYKSFGATKFLKVLLWYVASARRQNKVWREESFFQLIFPEIFQCDDADYERASLMPDGSLVALDWGKTDGSLTAGQHPSNACQIRFVFGFVFVFEFVFVFVFVLWIVGAVQSAKVFLEQKTFTVWAMAAVHTSKSGGSAWKYQKMALLVLHKFDTFTLFWNNWYWSKYLHLKFLQTNDCCLNI